MTTWITEFLRTFVRQNNRIIAIGETSLQNQYAIHQHLMAPRAAEPQDNFTDLLEKIHAQLSAVKEFQENEIDILGQIRDLLSPPPPIPGEMTLVWGQPASSGLGTLKQTLQDFASSEATTKSLIREEITMPGKETDVQTIPCSEMETDGAGNPVTIVPANVSWSIDDPTIATLTQNADGSATFKAVKPVAPAVNPRVANVTCTDTVTGAKAVDTLEVDNSASDPGKMVLTFGTAA
jgi:hypothetical protein